MATPPPRKLLRLRTLSPSELPSHSDLASAQNGTSASLIPFLTQLLSEGKSFADTTIPSTFTTLKTARLGAEKGGDVEVLAGGREVDDSSGGKDGRGEFWFARRSRHELLSDGKEVWEGERGRASWEELRQALFVEHSMKEGDYTPDIFEARRLLDWDGEIAKVNVEGWVNVGLCIYEMAHALQFPLSHRVFSTLVLTAQDYKSSFIIVQIPVDISKVPTAFYSNGKHKTSSSSTAKQKKSIVMGCYVSVERCRKKQEEGKETEVAQWDMATASDAGGSLPMVLQKKALPGVIAKDVQFVMDWLALKRERSRPKATSGGAAS